MTSRQAPLAMGEERFRLVAQVMRALLILVGILALAAVVAPESWSEVLGKAAVASLIAAPLLRVLWLATRWFRRGDYRYGAIAVGVFALAMIGFLLG